MEYVRGGKVKVCLPWPGDLDEQNRPVDDEGKLVAPGRRVCGHSDCMSPEHVRRPYTPRGTAATAA